MRAESPDRRPHCTATRIGFVRWGVRASCLAAVLTIAAAAAATATARPLEPPAEPATAVVGGGVALPEVLVLGDSLAVGMQRSLAAALPDRELTFNVRNGRTTPAGLRALRRELERHRPQAVVISLGTNDGSSPGMFSYRIRRVLREIPARACVVWPTVIRPRRKGTYGGLNRVLRAYGRDDRRLTVVRWDRMVAKGAVRLPDGVHPDARGYRMRSWVVAAAVRRGCD